MQFKPIICDLVFHLTKKTTFKSDVTNLPMSFSTRTVPSQKASSEVQFIEISQLKTVTQSMLFVYFVILLFVNSLNSSPFSIPEKGFASLIRHFKFVFDV